MAEDLPIDWNDARVKEFLSLIRLQVLSPLSLLINIFTICICTFITTPSLVSIERRCPTSISPHPMFIAIYVVALWATQLGYCVLILIARKKETKETITRGVGFPLVFSNVIFAICSICWVFSQFLLTTILLGILLLVLLYSNINLLVYHRPTWSRPLDLLFIHTPLRFFLVLPFQQLFALALFIALGLTYEPNFPDAPDEYTANPWPGFAVVLGTNLVSLAVIIIRKDLVWCIASAWLCASIWAYRYVPVPVYATVILFTFLHPVALIGIFLYEAFFKRRRVALEGDDHPGLYQNSQSAPPAQQPATENTGPQEVNVEAVWG